jgi:hypothetical protein
VNSIIEFSPHRQGLADVSSVAFIIAVSKACNRREGSLQGFYNFTNSIFFRTADETISAVLLLTMVVDNNTKTIELT